MNVIVMCVQRNVGMAAFVSFARHSPDKSGFCTRLKKRYPKNLFYLKNLYLHFSSPFSQECGVREPPHWACMQPPFPTPETYQIIEKP